MNRRPTVPAGSDEVVTRKSGGLIVIDRAAVVETDALSVTFTEKLLGPRGAGGTRDRPARRQSQSRRKRSSRDVHE